MSTRSRSPRDLTGLGAFALTALSGSLYAISFPPLAYRPLAWIAIVPFLAAIRMGGVWRAWWLGCFWAFVMTFITSDCLPDAVVTYYRQPVWLGWFMLFGATVITMVPYYTSFAVVYWLLARRYQASLPLLAAAAWAGAELLRVKVLGGNPWAVSGYSQVGFLPFMQVADLTGVHGMSFVLMAVNAALLELWWCRGGETGRRRAALIGAGTAAAILVAVLGYGSFRLHEDQDTYAGEAVEVALVQGNLDLGSVWNEEFYGKNLRQYLRMTDEVLSDSPVELVFWPESSMTFLLADEPEYRASIGQVIGPFDAQLIAGGPRVEGSGDEEAYFNSTFLIAPSGEIVASQDKIRLLPFAEYFPLESVDLVRRNFGRARQFAVGEAQPPLPSVAGRAGVIVCNEAMFPEPATRRVDAGAEILVSPSNDSWFGALKYSLQAFDIVLLRTVEQRRDMVRVSTAGPSAIIDAHGRVVVQTGTFAREVAVGEVRPRSGRTLYSRVGDLFGYLCLVIALAACLRPTRSSATRGDVGVL